MGDGAELVSPGVGAGTAALGGKDVEGATELLLVDSPFQYETLLVP